MNRHSLRASLVAAVLGAATLSISPAYAEEAPACDPVALGAAVVTAAAAEEAAKDAFTTHTSTSMKALAAKYKRTEKREAREAAAEARKALRAARTVPASTLEGRQLRAEARAAAAKARAEAREAAKVMRAGRAQMLALIKTQRAELKAVWDAAKVATQTAQKELADCEATLPPPPGV